MSGVPGIRIEDLPGHPDFVPLSALPGIAVDLRYASPNNFVNQDVYAGFDCAWLRREAADALMKASAWLRERQPGWRFLLLDALRPQRVQERLYAQLDGTPLVRYLAHPQRGSIHSFGMAIDVTLINEAGVELDMGSGFDQMDLLSHPEFEVELLAQGLLTAPQLAHRGWLRAALREAGFHGISTEWWHFDLGDRVAVREQLPRVL